MFLLVTIFRKSLDALSLYSMMSTLVFTESIDSERVSMRTAFWESFLARESVVAAFTTDKSCMARS
jgi:hypothetical protein